MKIVAFDTATRTGVAVGEAGGTPRAWTVDLGQARTQAGRFSRMLKATRIILEEHQPDLIAVEAPITGRMEASATQLMLIGVRACVIGEAERMGVRSVEYPVATIRKHFLGKHFTRKHFPNLPPQRARKEIKGMVIHRCRTLGWRVDDDNQADACALWDYACAMQSADHQMTTVGGLL